MFAETNNPSFIAKNLAMQAVGKLRDFLAIHQYLERAIGISLLLDRKKQIVHAGFNQLIDRITDGLLLLPGETRKLALKFLVVAGLAFTTQKLLQIVQHSVAQFPHK